MLLRDARNVDRPYGIARHLSATNSNSVSKCPNRRSRGLRQETEGKREEEGEGSDEDDLVTGMATWDCQGTLVSDIERFEAGNMVTLGVTHGRKQVDRPENRGTHARVFARTGVQAPPALKPDFLLFVLCAVGCGR